MITKTTPNLKIIKLIFLIAYILIILDITILSREPMLVLETEGTIPFWSYALWFHGDKLMGIQIIQNIMMFVPLGFLLSWNLYDTCKARPHKPVGTNCKARLHKPVGTNCKARVKAIACSLALSICIEVCQLIFKLGTFEFDDIFDNTLGGALGCAAFVIIAKVLGKNVRWLENICRLAAIALVAIGIVICITYIDRLEENGNLENQFAFQVKDITYNDGETIISGYCFVYEDPARDYEIWLKNCDTGEMVKAKTRKNLQSQDANKYYKCACDYSKAGFEATVTANKNTEYQLYAKWPRLKAIPTGEYINRKAPEGLKADGTDLSDIIAKGTLATSNESADCYVYQWDNSLYWIAGPTFDFDKGGSTYIQYHLETTQPDRLPKERIDNGWDWDNLSFVFEENEITDELDFGSYRVAVRPLPAEYAITAVTTGVYAKGKWQWRRMFRLDVGE